MKRYVEPACADGKYVRQTGGRGQYGHAVLELEPLSGEEESYVFEDKITGGVVPREFIQPINKVSRKRWKPV